MTKWRFKVSEAISPAQQNVTEQPKKKGNLNPVIILLSVVVVAVLMTYFSIPDSLNVTAN